MMNVIIRANKEKFKEVTSMCEALKELWAEDIEKSRNDGIRCMIEATKECGATWERVYELVEEKFILTREETEEYMKLYW